MLAARSILLRPRIVYPSLRSKYPQTPIHLRWHSYKHSHEPGHSHEHNHDSMYPEDDHIHLKSSETETNDELIFGVKGKNFEYINGSGNDSPSTSVQFEATPKKNKTILSKDKSNSIPLTHSHSSGHSHSHSTELFQDLTLRSALSNRGARITIIGLLTNVGMAIAKGAGGIMFHSQALLADAAHSISDLISDFLTLFTISFSSKKPNQLYPNGYGKIESLGSLSVSSLLFVAGISIGYSSLIQVVGPLVPASIVEMVHHYQEMFHISHSHSHSHSHTITNINAAWIAGGSIIIKEWLYQATKKVAISQNSNVLLANAWHHRVDSLTSVAALITIAGGHIFQVSWLDPLGGLLVSTMIVKAGFDGLRSAVLELIDRAVPKNDPTYLEIEKEVGNCLGKLISNNNSKIPYSIGELIVLSSGPNFIISNLRLIVPKQRWDNVLNINEFENVTRLVKGTLFEKIPNIKKISIEFIEEEELEKEKIESL